MLILALDTTSPAGSVAITRDGHLIAQGVGDPSVTHGERLPGDILAVLAEHGLRPSAIDLYAVAAGPGSFTGLRVGIATIQALALVHNRLVVPVSTLDALAALGRTSGTAAESGAELIGAWVDAQRGEVFTALYESEGFTPLVSASSAPPADTLAAWEKAAGGRAIAFIGDGALRYRTIISTRSGPARIIEPGPLAATIATLAADRAQSGEAVKPHAVRAIYVRRPDAELARERERR